MRASNNHVMGYNTLPIRVSKVSGASEPTKYRADMTMNGKIIATGEGGSETLAIQMAKKAGFEVIVQGQF